MKQTFPDDLGKLVSTDESKLLVQATKAPPAMIGGWLVAALLLLGATVGLLWFNRDQPTETVKLGAPEMIGNEGSSRRTLARFFRPNRAVSLRLKLPEAKKSKQPTQLNHNSTFAAKKKRPRFWMMGPLQLTRSHSRSRGDSSPRKRARKPDTNPKFRHLFRFEPIRYRRS